MIRASKPLSLNWSMQIEQQQLEEPVARESLESRHEAHNPPNCGILVTTALIVAMLVACLAIVWLLIAALSKSRPLDRSISARGTISAPDLQMLKRFAPPNLQVNPHDDLVALREREESELNSYGWVNRSNGIVRIPVKRAMELILQRGLPV